MRETWQGRRHNREIMRRGEVRMRSCGAQIPEREKDRERQGGAKQARGGEADMNRSTLARVGPAPLTGVGVRGGRPEWVEDGLRIYGVLRPREKVNTKSRVRRK